MAKYHVKSSSGKATFVEAGTANEAAVFGARILWSATRQFNHPVTVMEFDRYGDAFQCHGVLWVGRDDSVFAD